MASQDKIESRPENLVRVILWATPRSTSTSFLTAISQLDDTEVWYEPYFTARKLGPQRSAQTLASQHLAQKYDDLKKSGSDLVDIKGGYDSSLFTYDWVKENLERDVPEKQVLFVKEMIEGIVGRYDAIASGFKHSVLIRHPLKVFSSLRKMIDTTPNKGKKMTELPATMIPPGLFYKDLWELLKHIKQQDGSEVIAIIDTDDLLSDPRGIMRAYCEKMGIPFSEKLLKWIPGEDKMSEWVISSLFLQAFRLGIHNNTFNQTGFGRPSAVPDRTTVPQDVLFLADSSMPYYDMLYRERLTPN